MSEESDMERLITMLYDELNRWPTQEEVTGFIFGTNEERARIIREGRDTNV